MTRVLPALLGTVLFAGLTACSGGGDSSAEATRAANSPAASATVTPGEALPEATASPETATPLEVTVSPEATPAPGEGNESGITRIDAEETGQLSPLGATAIVVDTGKGTKEALLTADTVVLDAQGSVCSQGSVPHRCSSKQLAKALKAGVSFYAKVLIADGTAVKIEEIVRE